ncbi:hypothetical protein D9611_013237 [Ephemerocybe angulata]|uniref:Uncharacterized protein n=1 Tax=Ephemerocybe angulata TaxID=980116 RepID=A0A8H5CB27_9AGAR|nr:hypothetical protein D9611_013237 [Tulosesus angulatus]
MLPGLVYITLKMFANRNAKLSGAPRPCSGAGEYYVHVLGLGFAVPASPLSNHANLPHSQRKLTLRGFTHPQLQHMDTTPA